MSTSLRSPIWFVLLMAFVIGWSSVSVAAAKPIHQQMMMTANSSIHSENNNIAMNECHTSSLVHAQNTHEHNIKMSGDCTHVGPHTDLHSGECNECSQLHCQSLISWIYIQTPQLSHLNVIQELPAFHSDYAMQHLTGFWQQILRPPKA